MSRRTDPKIRAISAYSRGLLPLASASAYQAALGVASGSGLIADTDTTLAANSDANVATQRAVKTYIDNSVLGLLDLKGGTDCSANPNYPAALKGDAYYVTVAGKIGGASGKSVDVGDVYVASADNAGGTEASVGTSWFVLEHNLAGALLAANNLSDLTNPATARTNLGLGTVATLDSDTDTALAANSDSKVPTQKAVKAYVDASVGGGGGAFADLFAPIENPTGLSWTWRNQTGGSETAVVTEDANSILLTCVGTAGIQLRIREMAVPTPPYTLEAGFVVNVQGLNFTTMGLCWDDGTKVESIGPYCTSDTGLWKCAYSQWTNVTTFSATTTESAVVPGPLVYLKIEDDNTNRKAYMSGDGLNWCQIRTQARTTFLTPTHLGFYINFGNTSQKGHLRMVHWNQSW